MSGNQENPMQIHPNYVRETVGELGVQKKDLAEKAQVNKNTLNGIESPDWNPKWKTLEALCKAASAIRFKRT